MPIMVTMDNLEEVMRHTGRDIWDLGRLLVEAEDSGRHLYMSPGGSLKRLRGLYTLKYEKDSNKGRE